MILHPSVGFKKPRPILLCANVQNVTIFFLGVFLIQFNLVLLNLIAELVLMEI